MQYLAKPLLWKYVAAFSSVKQRLKSWQQLALELPPELQTQALASLKSKAFHCLGGAVYAVYPKVNRQVMLDAIVALQTISDYLDNLCDRVQVNDERAFRQLHLSFIHALDPSLPLADYYCFYPYKESLYLNTLVQTCRKQIQQMPYYEDYRPWVIQLANHYCNLQVLKHLSPSGPGRLQQWISQAFLKENPPLAWNEWAAATGSTLGIFYSFAASFHSYPPAICRKMHEAYFPWVQSLHILLDYLIDRHEDQIHGDLNFTFYHSDPEHAVSRIAFIYQTCKAQIASLPHASFHQLIVDGLVAMYGSDPKLQHQGLLSPYTKLLDSPATKTLLKACRLLRAMQILV